MVIRGAMVIVVAVAIIALLAAVAVIVAANYGIDFALPKFKL